jgi:hypothetical protein
MEVLEIYGNRKTNKFVSAKRHFIEIKPYIKGFFFFADYNWHHLKSIFHKADLLGRK